MSLVIIRGGGDIASGIIYRLFMSGYKIVVLETEYPSTIRRTVSFGEVVYSGTTEIEGIKGVLANDIEDIYKILEDGNIPIYVDPNGSIIKELKQIAIVDAILAKKNLGTNKNMAPITIGVGPGFEAGKDVDLVIESKRGHYLGKVIYSGQVAKNTGKPGEVLGYVEERVIRSNADGIVKPLYKIGDRIEKGDTVCQIGESRVTAQISGILRGMIKEGFIAKKGLKIGDIDPRGVKDHIYTISDKALAVGGGVLEGILYLTREMEN